MAGKERAELGGKKSRMSDAQYRNPSMPLLLNLPDALKEEIVEHLLSGSERNAEHRKLAIRAMKRL